MPPVLALIALAALAVAAPAAAQEAPRTLTVAGEGQVEAAPDRASFTAGVQAEALRAAEALAATSEAMRAVFAALEAAGVAPEDMQTSQLAVDPVWEESPEGRQPRVGGYAASNLVTVRVREIARLGELIDAVGAAGANRVFGVAFEVAEPRAALDEARRRAVADARARAELLAGAAGVALGPVLSIREGGGGPGPMMRMEAAMSDAGAPVAGGVVSVGASVEIVWAIE